MKNINDLKEKIEYSFKSMKDFDPVDCSEAELWKPHRKFEKIKLCAEDLNLPKNVFEFLAENQELAWMYCNTINMESHSERGYHYIDYALHGERLNWKKGDEYWLVVNCAIDGGRLELRKPDPNKWTPLEKYYVDKNLNIKIKLYAENDFFTIFFNSKGKYTKNRKLVKNLGVISYPDRIELTLINEDINQIIDYFYKFSSFKYKEKNFKLRAYFYNLLNNDLIKEELKKYKNNVGFNRTYNLYNKNDKNENVENYKQIFLKSHEVLYRQKHIENFSKEYLENTVKIVKEVYNANI